MLVAIGFWAMLIISTVAITTLMVVVISQGLQDNKEVEIFSKSTHQK